MANLLCFDECNSESQIVDLSSETTEVADDASKKKTSSFHCCVPLCNGDSRYNPELKFHRLPGRKRDEHLKKEWLVKIRRVVGPDFKLTSSTRVCSRHFTEEDYNPPSEAGRQLLKKDAVPSKFDWSAKHKARRKIIRHIDRDTQTDESDADDENPSTSTSTAFSMDDLQTELQTLRAQFQDVQNQLEQSKSETAAAIDEVKRVKAQASAEIEEIRKQAAEQLALTKFGVERFGTDDEAIKFYTGFTTYAHFKFFFNFLQPCADRMTYCYASGERESRPASRRMLLIDELFMFCVRLKLGLFELDLANRFLIHRSSVCRKLITWANFLYFLLGSQVIWPSRQVVDKCMPEGFKKFYGSTRVILDCTEIFVQTPTSLLLQSQLYSSYKSNTTLKGLIGITPNGAISFVSSLFTGNISDKEITRCSGILELLEPGDAVMADKGFNIDDLLQEKGVELNIPPFLEDQTQFSVQDVQKTKTIASLRIHVERAIRRVKEYHFFDADVPLSTLGSVNQLYTVACLLTNFQGPLILANSDNEA